MEMVHFKKLNANLKMIIRLLIILSLLITFQAIGNQYALTTILAFLFAVPVMVVTEGFKITEFMAQGP